MAKNEQREKARAIFQKHGGLLRIKNALRLGIHPRTLYAMRDSGEIDRISREYYRLAELPQPGNPDLVTVALAVPKGVICLISAMAYHGIGTQIPHTVDIAIEKDTKRPRIGYPPIRTFWFSGPAFTEGIQVHSIDDVPVRIYTDNLAEIVSQIATFLLPVLENLISGKAFVRVWQPPDPWSFRNA